MSHEKLLAQFKRLLEYSGSVVDDVSVTQDGATAVVYIEGQPHRIFIAPLFERPREIKELGASFLIDTY